MHFVCPRTAVFRDQYVYVVRIHNYEWVPFRNAWEFDVTAGTPVTAISGFKDTEFGERRIQSLPNQYGCGKLFS